MINQMMKKLMDASSFVMMFILGSFLCAVPLECGKMQISCQEHVTRSVVHQLIEIVEQFYA